MYVGYDTSTRGGGLSVFRQGSMEPTPGHERGFGYTVIRGITFTIVRYAPCTTVLHRDMTGNSVLYKNLAPQLPLPCGRCYYTCALLYTRDAYRLPHGRHVC